jgi:hypothetical protein
VAAEALKKTETAWNEAERDWELWTMSKYTGEDWTGEKFGKLHKKTKKHSEMTSERLKTQRTNETETAYPSD